MQFRYLPWAIVGGAVAVAVPGTPLWIAPLVGAALHMAYDADPESFHDAGTKLLATTQQYQLGQRVRGLLPSGNPAQNETTSDGIDEEEDRALAQTMLDHRRQRAASGDPQAVKELRQVEQQIRQVYPDLLDTQPTPRIVMPDAFDQAITRVQQPTKERDPLLQTLEQEPHRLIIGRSRGGKTTLIHEMATHWADEGAKVVVCDPDAMPGLWPGCTVVGHGNNTAKIGQVLKVTAQEFERREMLWGQGQRDFQPIHVVIDEAHEVLPVIDGALEIFEDLTRRGAKRAIHLTIGVQDKQIATLGLKGKSELLKNFIVADVLKDGQGQRKAVIQDAVTGKRTAWQIPQMRDPMSLIKVQPMSIPAQPVYPAARQAGTAQAVEVADGDTERLADPLLDSLLASTTITSDGAHITINNQMTAQQPTKARNSRKVPSTGYNPRKRVAAIQASRKTETLEEAYARLRAEGVPSFRQAYEIMGSKGSKDLARAAWNKAAQSQK